MSQGRRWHCEAEIVEGLEDIAAQELSELPRVSGSEIALQTRRNGLVQLEFQGDLTHLLALRSVIAVSLRHRFDVPRPKALLGHQNFHALLDLMKVVQSLHPAGSFRTLSIDAAGSGSSVMQRLRSELASAAELIPTEDRGDMVLRLRPSLNGSGWDALVRLSPRPLVTRDWRIINYEGALNASVAYAVATLIRPQPDDVYLNIACGSGSLLIERAGIGPAGCLIGIDRDWVALTYATSNITASGHTQIQLLHSDARQLPLPAQSVDALTADLPFGQRVGSHAENQSLYPVVLREAARVARPGARFAIITHEVRLMDAVLNDNNLWKLTETRMITLRGLHPRIYVLERS